MSFAAILIGLAVLGLAGYLVTNRAQIWWKRAIGFLLSFPIGMGALSLGSLRLWQESGVAPEPKSMTIGTGVRYTRNVRTTGSPLVWHIARVDLTAPGLSFTVTPGDGSRVLPLTARTTSDALREFHADLAISGDVFEPAFPASAYEPPPFPGQSVKTRGMASSRGAQYASVKAAADQVLPTFYVTENNQANIGTPSGTPYNAISGSCIFMSSGKLSETGCDGPGVVKPRAALGLDAARTTLVLIVVDGYRAARSPGATLAQLAEIMKQEGVDTALELAGGSAATMAGRVSGQQRLLSEPVTAGVPGIETPIANHLLITTEQRLTTAY
jgi:hypothetical protein